MCWNLVACYCGGLGYTLNKPLFLLLLPIPFMLTLCSHFLCMYTQWDHSSKIAKIGWTSNESLVVLARDGIYRLYPISSSGTSGSVITSNYVSSSSNTSPSSSPTYTQHSLTHDVQDTHIVDAVIYDDGMVILLSSHQFIQVKGWPESSSGAGGGEYGVSSSSDAANAGAGSGTSSSGSTSTFIASSSSKKTNDHTQHQNDNNNRYGKGRVARMVETDFDHSPSTWCILTPDQSTSRQSEVIVSYNDAVFAIDELEIQDQVGQKRKGEGWGSLLLSFPKWKRGSALR